MNAKRLLFFPALILLNYMAFSQMPDSTRNEFKFSGTAGITNNGISMIPTFSLGKPAGILTLSMGGERFRIDPELRFSLSGKPWSFLVWFRYELLKNSRFTFRIGAHPALNYKTETIHINGETQDQVIARRYVAEELAPNFNISKNTRIGMYYLHANGMDKGTIRHTHFITFNSNFSNIKLSGSYLLSLTPQLYYLKMDANDGYFATGAVGLTKTNFPLSLSLLFNKELRKGIEGARDLVWNATLTYSFGKTYITK